MSPPTLPHPKPSTPTSSPVLPRVRRSMWFLLTRAYQSSRGAPGRSHARPRVGLRRAAGEEERDGGEEERGGGQGDVGAGQIGGEAQRDRAGDVSEVGEHSKRAHGGGVHARRRHVRGVGGGGGPAD